MDPTIWEAARLTLTLRRGPVTSRREELAQLSASEEAAVNHKALRPPGLPQALSNVCDAVYGGTTSAFSGCSEIESLKGEV